MARDEEIGRCGSKEYAGVSGDVCRWKSHIGVLTKSSLLVLFLTIEKRGICGLYYLLVILRSWILVLLLVS